MESKKGSVDKNVDISSEHRNWAMFTHFSAFAGYFTGLGFLVAPIIMWVIKKDESEFLNHHGKEAINFQLSMLIYGFVVLLLCLLLIGFLLIPVIVVMQFILMIIAGIKANEGVQYRYPLTIRFIK